MELTEQRLRERINRSPASDFCRQQLAQIATDTKWSGFEDPRSAAVGKMEEVPQNWCMREECEAEVKVDTMTDSVSTTGTCRFAEDPKSKACLKDAWDEAEAAVEAGTYTADTDAVNDEVFPQKTSEEVLSFHCPQFNCDFNAGFTIDGGKGTGGQCAKERGDPIGTDLPLSEVDVEIRLR